MGDQARPGTTGLFQGDLDAQVTAGVAVIERGHRPGQPGLVRVVLRMVVEAVAGELLHRSSQPNSCPPGRPARSGRSTPDDQAASPRAAQPVTSVGSSTTMPATEPGDRYWG